MYGNGELYPSLFSNIDPLASRDIYVVYSYRHRNIPCRDTLRSVAVHVDESHRSLMISCLPHTCVVLGYRTSALAILSLVSEYYTVICFAGKKREKTHYPAINKTKLHP